MYNLKKGFSQAKLCYLAHNIKNCDMIFLFVHVFQKQTRKGEPQINLE